MIRYIVNIYQFLEENSIEYQRFDHPAVFTCEEAEKLCPVMPGASIKNLFVHDGNKQKYFLLVVGQDKSVDLKKLSKVLAVSKLSFASPGDLDKYLGVTPGAVTLLGVINDNDNIVKVIIDEDLQGKSLQCHPLVNTATLVIPYSGIESFLKLTNHDMNIVSMPTRTIKVD